MLIALRFRQIASVNGKSRRVPLGGREPLPIQLKLTIFGGASVIDQARSRKIENSEILNTERVEILQGLHISPSSKG